MPPDPARLGDVELTGHVEGFDGTKRFRMRLRLDPPGMRLEHWSAGARADDPPAVVYVSGAHRAWRVHPAGGRGSRAGEIAAVLDRMHEMRLLLRAIDFRDSMFPVPGGGTLPAVPGWPAPGVAPPADLAPGRPAHSLSTASPSSLLWLVHFDPTTGRMLGLDQPQTLTRPWLRLTDWRRFGKLMLPARRIQGSEAFDPLITVVEEVRTGLSLPDALFAGDPWTPPAEAAAVAPLRVVPSVVPGSGYLLVSDVRVDGARASALFDTAADGLFVSYALERRAGLGTLAMHTAETLFGTTSTARQLVGTLDVGSQRLVQVPSSSARLPSLAEMSPDARPDVLVGGWPMMQLHPVLDLEAGRFVARPDPPPPLERTPSGTATDGRTVLEVPFDGPADERGAGLVVVTVRFAEGEVDLLLDTGFPFMARLSASGLRKLGLPTSREAWLARNAASVRLGGAGSGRGADLLVRTQALSFGPVTHEHPYVFLAGLGSQHEAQEFPFDGLLGAAALLPFARVGFDGRRRVIELETRAGAAGGTFGAFPAVRLDDGGTRVVVEDPGLFLGMFPGSPAVTGGGGADSLPRLLDVHWGSSAWMAGVRRGDRIVSIDGAPVGGRAVERFATSLWTRDDARVTLRLIRGAEGDDDTSPGDEFDVTLP